MAHKEYIEDADDAARANLRADMVQELIGAAFYELIAQYNSVANPEKLPSVLNRIDGIGLLQECIRQGSLLVAEDDPNRNHLYQFLKTILSGRHFKLAKELNELTAPTEAEKNFLRVFWVWWATPE